jgi:hypothetical protein
MRRQMPVTGEYRWLGHGCGVPRGVPAGNVPDTGRAVKLKRGGEIPLSANGFSHNGGRRAPKSAPEG